MRGVPAIYWGNQKQNNGRVAINIAYNKVK